MRREKRGRLTPSPSDALRFFRLEYSLYFLKKILQGDRFGLIAVESLSQHSLPVVRHRGRRDRDDGDALGLWVGLELLHRRNPVHPGKLDVHENQRGRLVSRQLKPFLRGLALDSLVPLHLKHVSGKLPVLVVVLDYQYQLSGHFLLNATNFRFWIEPPFNHHSVEQIHEPDGFNRSVIPAYVGIQAFSTTPHRIPSDRSIHPRFCSSIRSNFQGRFHSLICFSRVIADTMSPCSS